jgi:hypothetical protein
MSRGSMPYCLHIAAAQPTATPICPQVFCTRGLPIPTWVQLKLRPAIIRLGTLRE